MIRSLDVYSVVSDIYRTSPVHEELDYLYALSITDVSSQAQRTTTYSPVNALSSKLPVDTRLVIILIEFASLGVISLCVNVWCCRSSVCEVPRICAMKFAKERLFVLNPWANTPSVL